MPKVVENIERIRERKGVTKTFMASKLGYKTSMGYKHLATADIKSEQIVTCSEVLGVDPCIFFKDELTESVIRELEHISK